jgi:GTP:adenosylcobinamide-phosphate guanylyltransferase
MKLKIRIMQQPAALLLSVILLLNICFYPAVAWAGEAQLLNDRSADIVNSRALAGMDMVVPGGLTGAGQVVGIADSGLDKGSTTDIHPDLESQSGQMPKVVMLKSFSGRETADDPSGHGTHMAATIAGNGQASAGKYRGIAPGASIYFQALLDENNQLHIPSDINTLFEPAYQAGVRIHVNGWGRAGNYYAPITSQIDKFVWEHPDFLPLFGAGNNGPALATLTSEANSKNGLTIGSSQTPRPHLVKDIFADEGKTFDYGMQYAADYVLRNGSQDRLADSVMILGGDIPCLQPATIREAFRKLDLLASSPAAYACAVCKEGNPPIGGAIVESADQEAGFNIIAFTCTTPFDFNGVFYNPYGITALDMIARKAAEHKIPISLVDMLPDIDLPVDLASLIPVVKTLQLAEKFDSTLVAPQRTIRILESLGFETVAGPQ